MANVEIEETCQALRKDRDQKGSGIISISKNFAPPLKSSITRMTE
jgi:hypothetical protein